MISVNFHSLHKDNSRVEDVKRTFRLYAHDATVSSAVHSKKLAIECVNGADRWPSIYLLVPTPKAV